MIEIGNKAPDFCAKNQDDVEICLRDLKGKWIVLYFYPKDLTPGCTTEACEFSQSEPEFDDLDAIILGVSPDETQKHRKFIEKKELTITLLSDIDKKMCEDYEVWQLKKFMGKEYMGVVRSTFIINPEGEIAAMWTKVKVKGHVEAVKDKLKQLQN
ncbi:thioredoxin-dependent thiol peroxidase [Malaciobacter molluscorum LMG 25693]|uniref:Putative peroxiredoxin bcp n=1 Tax=Malaciobacter molluscorum LMG 25693 TaxID=870501 RepID=A0A2G1DEI6_9BACT|nr:thioredoxin-dependent thiol peroxidase [Malaciobacter molluscorum]AXX91197.1 thiol peroxidase [Malaciobacter molluscorum LMG 25693]PHO16898.1 thioredoxin-dependent thiol peroxidase [Malaciobacter molluscorum LMG 25693]RXJ91933.1 thioredoxin-dependent thiol peroxidase [Malaciobacter molluscorum]